MTNPTPTPLASTAIEAAREITGYIPTDWDPFYIAAKKKKILHDADVIEKHFQPLLAKMEGERDAMRKNRDECAAVFILHRDHEQELPKPECACPSCNLNRQLIALRADLAAAKEERDAAMEILDTVARGFDRSLGRLLVDDKAGAERELKLAIAHVDNPHGYTGKSMAQLRADLAAKEAALAEMKSDLKREVELNDKMAKQRVPINNDDVREFVLMALCQHTLLNSDERQDCAEQILTAFAPACEELKHSVSELMDALAAKGAALKHVGGVLNKNGDWDDGCFYYNRVSAPELQGCLVVIASALASRADKGGAT